MTTLTSNRHLAAILFTDIVGYTSMMQRDEQLALAAVRRFQEVLERQVPAHHGEVYQYYGDGSMSIFHSASHALQCAYDIQVELIQSPRVHLRTGIHIGEIYTENGKVFGDGVNIASRIESMGQAGSVLFSRDVFEKVRNHTSFQMKSIGTFEFKNVEDPIEVFALTNEGIVVPDLRQLEGKFRHPPAKKKKTLQLWLSGIILILLAGYFVALKPSAPHEQITGDTPKSIAVLPFTDIGGEDKEDFLSIGLAEDILTQLAQIPGLKVIARTSSMRYENSDKPIKKIAQELGVASVLEGSVRRYENSLRVSVQLIHGVHETLLWAADFDREMGDVLNVQRDVALAVSDKLRIALTPNLRYRLSDKVRVDPDAYMEYQRGQEILMRSNGTREDMEKAIGFFQRALDRDSTFVKAWVGLGDANLEAVYWHRLESDLALPRAERAAQRALALDPHLGEAHGLLGGIMYLKRNLRESETHLRKAIEYSPNYSWAYERLAWVMLLRGDRDEAFTLFDRSIELDPLASRYKGSVGNAYAILGEYRQGIETMENYLVSDPQDNYLLWTLGFLYARSGQYVKAIEVLLRRSIGTKTNWVLTYCYAKTGQRQLAEEILQRNVEKSKSELVPDFMMAVQMCALGRHEEALDYLEKGVANQGENFFIIALDHDPMFEDIWKHPRFSRLVERVKGEFVK